MDERLAWVSGVSIVFAIFLGGVVYAGTRHDVLKTQRFLACIAATKNPSECAMAASK